MRRLEDLHWRQRRCALLEEQAYPSPCRSRREGLEELGAGGERHALLRLIADDPCGVVGREMVYGFGEEPRLATAGVAHDYRRDDAVARTREKLSQHAELLRSADECRHHG